MTDVPVFDADFEREVDEALKWELFNHGSYAHTDEEIRFWRRVVRHDLLVSRRRGARRNKPSSVVVSDPY